MGGIIAHDLILNPNKYNQLKGTKKINRQANLGKILASCERANKCPLLPLQLPRHCILHNLTCLVTNLGIYCFINFNFNFNFKF